MKTNLVPEVSDDAAVGSDADNMHVMAPVRQAFCGLQYHPSRTAVRNEMGVQVDDPEWFIHLRSSRLTAEGHCDRRKESVGLSHSTKSVRRV